MDLTKYKIGAFAVDFTAMEDRIQNRAAWLKEQFNSRGDQIRKVYDKLMEDLPGLVNEEISHAVFETGASDMASANYDPDGAVKKAGGIGPYVDEAVRQAITGVLSMGV